MINNIKEFNNNKYSKKSKKYKVGKRPNSPWYFLIGKIEKNYLSKFDLNQDFQVNNFKPIKIKIKKSKKRKGNGI